MHWAPQQDSNLRAAAYKIAGDAAVT